MTLYIVPRIDEGTCRGRWHAIRSDGAGMRTTTMRIAAALSVLVSACGSSDDPAGTPAEPRPSLESSRDYRAIAGVSMGAYGALNLGTKRGDLFGTIASLGGPVDMQQLIVDAVADNLEVKAQTGIPRMVGDDFTFDHLAPYPDRDTRVTMFQDLVIAFGNPFLHHPDPARRYLGSDSEPATKGRDDRFDDFTAPADPRGFRDGGDVNQDGLRQQGETASLFADVALLAKGSLTEGNGVDVGGRRVADLDGDGVYDVGEGIVVNTSEPFTDGDGDLVFDAGETFSDVGLDGVAATGDFGEGNGSFDYDPDRARWLEQDPRTRLAGRSATQIATQRIYMDVGIQDEFGFARHYEHLVTLLRGKGLSVDEQSGFDGNCADLPGPDGQFLLVHYDAGHIGVDSVDPDDLLDGDVCGSDTVWQRVISMLGFLEESFPDGNYGPGNGIDLPDIDDIDDLFGLDLVGDMSSVDVPSPALSTGGGSPARNVFVYRPPAFFGTADSFPIVYFLGGYGQQPSDFDELKTLFDLLILTGQMQNMYFAFVPGDGGRKGSFYVNHVVPHTQVPDIASPTSGRYQDSLLQDIVPAIEDGFLRSRIRF